jgi:hypothetical protein
MATAARNPSNQPLWSSLARFSSDDPDDERPFSARLAQEQDWSAEYTDRCIHEYIRFLDLTATCDHPAVPSWAVDPVGHGHLIYTRSSWNELCAHVWDGRSTTNRPAGVRPPIHSTGRTISRRWPATAECSVIHRRISGRSPHLE